MNRLEQQPPSGKDKTTESVGIQSDGLGGTADDLEERIRYFFYKRFNPEKFIEVNSWKEFSLQVGRASARVNPRNPQDNIWPDANLKLIIEHWLNELPIKEAFLRRVGMREFKEGLVQGIWVRYEQGDPEFTEQIIPYMGLYPLRMAGMLIADGVCPRIGKRGSKGAAALARFAGIYLKYLNPVVPIDKIPLWIYTN